MEPEDKPKELSEEHKARNKRLIEYVRNQPPGTVEEFITQARKLKEASRRAEKGR